VSRCAHVHYLHYKYVLPSGQIATTNNNDAKPWAYQLKAARGHATFHSQRIDSIVLSVAK